MFTLIALLNRFSEAGRREGNSDLFQPFCKIMECVEGGKFQEQSLLICIAICIQIFIRSRIVVE
jgi:hypothetical protein